MKKIIICLLLGLTTGVVFGQANVPAIVVSTFSTRGQTVTADDAESITELFIAELAKQSGIRVVDRTSLERVVTEMRFQTSDWSDSQKTTQLGKALNAEYLVRGQINQLGQQISVAINALDIKTLEVVSSSTETFDSKTIYSQGYEGIFYKMQNRMASNIANPIKTKMTQLAEQRKKEQEEREKQQQRLSYLQEQGRYSLVGTWIIGDFYNNETLTNLIYMTNNSKEGKIRQNRANNYSSSTRRLLSFNANGTIEDYYEYCDYDTFKQQYRKGTYTRKDDKVEFSLSGTETELRGSNWSNWNNDYREYKNNTRNNVSEAGTTTIEFRGGGNALIFGGRELRRQW